MDAHSAKALRLAASAAVSSGLLCFASFANAAAIITSIELQIPDAGGSLDSVVIDNENNTVDIAKTFTTLDPMVLTFTVGHTEGGGNQFTVTESITNATGIAWDDFHFEIIEPDPPNGVVFNAFASSTLDGFSLDPAPDSGPRNLNFTGFLAAGGSTTGSFFLLNPPDPGAGNTFTFDLVQTPTPIPVPAAVWLLGTGLAGMLGMARRGRLR